MPDASDASAELVLHLDGFDGPLDLLLDLAQRQKLDLTGISMLSLAEQYLAVVEGAASIRLELAADWLVMAAWLAWLKSRLLLPPGEDADGGEQAAEILGDRLRDLEAVRLLSAWLAARPLLGQGVFARGAAAASPAVARPCLAIETIAMPALLRAHLAVLRRARRPAPYRPAAVTSWSVADALARLARLMGSLTGWTLLERFLPEPLSGKRERRTALASTLLAALEMTRDGAMRLRQPDAFGPILVSAAGEAAD